MLKLFDHMRDISLLTVFLRLLLAVVCGGLIGLEREYKRRPAGFRTHILICLGAVMATLTGQYLGQYMGYDTDMSRLGAQVVAGVGFIGAGTIIVTKRQRVKGLTTAAGLWTVAIVGLCLGAGFYEGGLIVTALVLIAELVFAKLEYRMMRSSPEVNLFVEYTGKAVLDELLRQFREQNVKVLDVEITRSRKDEQHNACVIFSLRLNKKSPAEKLLEQLLGTEGVLSVEEL